MEYAESICGCCHLEKFHFSAEFLNEKWRPYPLDPIPTFLVLKLMFGHSDSTDNGIGNLSPTEGAFTDLFKQAIVTPLIKKPSLVKDEPRDQCLLSVSSQRLLNA